MKDRSPVRWATGLFVANFCLQRVAVPGLGIPVTVPLSLLWMGLALVLGVVAINPRRLFLWMTAAGLTAVLVIPQVVLVRLSYVSVTSWGFWMVIWLPMVLRLTGATAETFRDCCRALAKVGVAISGLSIVFMVSQLLGVRYRDWVGQWLPDSLEVQGYTIAYPVVYGSPIYKSNAWLALEPSFLSFMLGVTVICAMVARLGPVVVGWLIVGLLSTTAGSGVALVAAYLAAAVVLGQGRQLLRYLLPIGGIAALSTASFLGQAIWSRLTEAGTSRSSTSLRGIDPYLYLWQPWVSDPAIPFVGGGAGASQWIIANSGIPGLLTPSVAKVLFDYGLVGGGLLLAVMIVTYLRTRDPAFAFAIAASMLTVQAASQPLILCTMAALTMWSAGEDEPVGVVSSHAQQRPLVDAMALEPT